MFTATKIIAWILNLCSLSVTPVQLMEWHFCLQRRKNNFHIPHRRPHYLYIVPGGRFYWSARVQYLGQRRLKWEEGNCGIVGAFWNMLFHYLQFVMFHTCTFEKGTWLRLFSLAAGANSSVESVYFLYINVIIRFCLQAGIKNHFLPSLIPFK